MWRENAFNVIDYLLPLADISFVLLVEDKYIKSLVQNVANQYNQNQFFVENVKVKREENITPLSNTMAIH